MHLPLTQPAGQSGAQYSGSFGGLTNLKERINTDHASGRNSSRAWIIDCAVDLPFATSAHPRSRAFSVAATVLAHRHAFSVRSLHPWLELVSRSAFAHVGRHALAVHASMRADGLTLAVHLLVAQHASAHVRREAVGVLLASLLAVRPANTLLSDPSRRTAAHVRPCAISAQASLGADRVAGTGAKVALVAVATIQNRYPSTFLLTRERKNGKEMRNYFSYHART